MNHERDGAVAFAAELGCWLEDKGLNVCATRNVSEASQPSDELFDTLIHDSDLVVVLGGDGSLLGASRRAAPAGKPLLGIHWGGTGFLSECYPDGARDAIERVLRGDFYVEDRLMLMAQLWRDGAPSCSCQALNDVAVTRETLSRILRLEVTVGDETAATYKGDGVIVCTPTGSTAHSLSAGGPVLDPRVEALVITPICPHSFNGRAIVAPSSETVRIRHSSPLGNVIVTLDGQIGMPMLHTDCLEIARAPWPARFIRFGAARFYHTLRDKLNWKI